MPPLHCFVCEKEFEPDETSAMPFCSERCKLIDLGRWVDEGYGIPYESEEGPDWGDPHSG